MSTDELIPEDLLDWESALLEQIVGVATEDLQAVRGHVDRGEGVLHLGGSGLLGEPAGGHAATLDDASVALHAGDVADTETSAEHGVAESLDVGPLSDGSELLTFRGGSDVVVVEGSQAQEQGRDADTGQGLTGGAHLLGGLFVHLRLEAGELTSRGLADELGKGEALQLLLLLWAEGALIEQGALRGLFDLRFTELIGEGLDLAGQSVTLGGVGLGLKGRYACVQVGSNFVRFSHNCFVLLFCQLPLGSGDC